MLPKSYSSVFAYVCVCMCMCLRLYCLGQSRNCRLRHHSVVTNKEPNLIPHAVINKLMQYYTGMRIFYRTLLSSACVRESGSHFQIKNIQPYTSGKRRCSEEFRLHVSFVRSYQCLQVHSLHTYPTPIRLEFDSAIHSHHRVLLPKHKQYV